ncbi:PLDc N-terminal domain-containing protein [Nocardioides sp. MH1]|uniref:PLDc N-terminal domain-containing protein n=1 Tax=Nocardioides sp. MH1 TaxID=3242490 RepID=UPI00352181C3
MTLQLISASRDTADSSASAIGFLILLAVVLVILAAAGFWLWSLIDVLRRSDAEWTAAGQSKVTWVVVVVILGWLGAVLYFFIARPALRTSRAPAL